MKYRDVIKQIEAAGWLLETTKGSHCKMFDKYLVIIEPATDGSYSAYLPDVPGCVSCGDTLDEVKENIQEALDFHFEGMRQAGLPIPQPTSVSEYVAVGAN